MVVIIETTARENPCWGTIELYKEPILFDSVLFISAILNFDGLSYYELDSYIAAESQKVHEYC